MLPYIRLLGKNRFKTSFTFLMVLCAVACAGIARGASGPVGKAAVLKGAVFVEREGRSIAAKAGDSVFLKDKWQTKGDGSVEIVFLDESRVKMAPGSMMEITEYLYDPSQKSRQGLLSMMSGKARFVVQDLQDFKEKRFRVQGQTAVVGTRDTDFVVRVRSGSAKESICREELLEALCIENVIIAVNRTTPDKGAVITTNMITQVCGNNPPTPPRFATPAERADLLKGLEEIGSRKLPRAETGIGVRGTSGGETSTGLTHTPPPEVIVPPFIFPSTTTTTTSSSTTTTSTTLPWHVPRTTTTTSTTSTTMPTTTSTTSTSTTSTSTTSTSTTSTTTTSTSTTSTSTTSTSTTSTSTTTTLPQPPQPPIRGGPRGR